MSSSSSSSSLHIQATQQINAAAHTSSNETSDSYLSAPSTPGLRSPGMASEDELTYTDMIVSSLKHGGKTAKEIFQYIEVNFKDRLEKKTETWRNSILGCLSANRRNMFIKVPVKPNAKRYNWTLTNSSTTSTTTSTTMPTTPTTTGASPKRANMPMSPTTANSSADLEKLRKNLNKQQIPPTPKTPQSFSHSLPEQEEREKPISIHTIKTEDNMEIDSITTNTTTTTNTVKSDHVFSIPSSPKPKKKKIASASASTTTNTTSTTSTPENVKTPTKQKKIASSPAAGSSPSLSQNNTTTTTTTTTSTTTPVSNEKPQQKKRSRTEFEVDSLLGSGLRQDLIHINAQFPRNNKATNGSNLQQQHLLSSPMSSAGSDSHSSNTPQHGSSSGTDIHQTITNTTTNQTTTTDTPTRMNKKRRLNNEQQQQTQTPSQPQQPKFNSVDDDDFGELNELEEGNVPAREGGDEALVTEVRMILRTLGSATGVEIAQRVAMKKNEPNSRMLQYRIRGVLSSSKYSDIFCKEGGQVKAGGARWRLLSPTTNVSSGSNVTPTTIEQAVSNVVQQQQEEGLLLSGVFSSEIGQSTLDEPYSPPISNAPSPVSSFLFPTGVSQFETNSLILD